MNATLPLPVGTLLREWRQRRHLSQLDLAVDAAVSTRHLSCVETGRALPSREMVLRLAERLEVPLRERNRLLNAAGYAPMFAERRLDDPALQAARAAVELVLRLSLHPQGLAPRILNLAQWRSHLFARLRQQIAASADPVLAALLDELKTFPAPPDGVETHAVEPSVVIPLQFASPSGTLSFISTTTVFGTPVDITLSELALETFFPADAATALALRRHLGDGQDGAVAA